MYAMGIFYYIPLIRYLVDAHSNKRPKCTRSIQKRHYLHPFGAKSAFNILRLPQPSITADPDKTRILHRKYARQNVIVLVL
jgi:hypothetical protein